MSPNYEMPRDMQPADIRTIYNFRQDFVLPLPRRIQFESMATDGPMIRTIGPTSLEGQERWGQTYYLQGKTNGVFRPLRAIICPYSTQEQLALVHRSGVFYDFTDIYHRIYERNETVRSNIDFVKSIEVAFWLINLDTYHTFFHLFQAILPEDPVDVVCEMTLFTNFSLGVTADERCTFFRRHGVNFEFNDMAIGDDNADDNDDADFDDAIRNEW